MKRILLFLALAVTLAVAVTSKAQWLPVLTGSVAGNSTYTLQQTLGTNAAAGIASASTASRTFAASSAVAGSTFTCTRVRIVIGRNGTGDPSLTGYIWADASGAPGTLLGTSTNTVNGTALATGGGNADFDFSGVALTSGTTYWFGFRASVVDASNNNPFRGGNTGTGVQFRSQTGTTSSWSSDNTRQGNFLLYSSP